jgi:hypothetical protein
LSDGIQEKIGVFMPIKFATHSKRVQRISIEHGWRASARYTNLRDVKEFPQVDFIDIDFKNYDFEKHIYAVKKCRPHLTVAQDIFKIEHIDDVIRQAEHLNRYSDKVIIVPKDNEFKGNLERIIPKNFLFGYSVPTKYGGTPLDPSEFKRPVHLLGGRPDVQRKLGDKMRVYSLDCNRFTLDAAFGDYFVGDKFKPHPVGGYENCIRDSIRNINTLWNHFPHSKKQRTSYESELQLC